METHGGRRNDLIASLMSGRSRKIDRLAGLEAAENRRFLEEQGMI